MTIVTDPELIAVLKGAEALARQLAPRYTHFFPTQPTQPRCEDDCGPHSRAAQSARIAPGVAYPRAGGTPEPAAAPVAGAQTTEEKAA